MLFLNPRPHQFSVIRMSTDIPQEWSRKGIGLSKVFQFGNFVEAVAFVVRIVPLAEEMNHHPDIGVFSFNKVRVRLVTHDAGGRVTGKDVELARRIDALFARRSD